MQRPWCKTSQIAANKALHLTVNSKNNQEKEMKLWPYVLGAWLVLYGLNSVIQLNFQYEHTVMGILALVAGVFVFIRM